MACIRCHEYTPPPHPETLEMLAPCMANMGGKYVTHNGRRHYRHAQRVLRPRFPEGAALAVLDAYSLLVYKGLRGGGLHGLLMPIDVTPTRICASILPRVFISRDLVGLTHRPQRRDQSSFYRMACSGQGYLPQCRNVCAQWLSCLIKTFYCGCLAVCQWKDGARNTTGGESGGRRVGHENMLLKHGSAKRRNNRLAIQ